MCAWETYSQECFEFSARDTKQNENWLQFPHLFQEFCKVVHDVVQCTSSKLIAMEITENEVAASAMIHSVLPPLMAKILAYETLPNELPTILLWSTTQHSAANPAVIHSKLTLLRQYLTNSIEREVSSALESFPLLFHPCHQPVLLNGQAWRPSLVYEQKSLNDRKNVESFVTSSTETKQQQQQIERLAGISETEELVMLCRWARCDVFGKDKVLIQKILSIIDFGTQQILKTLNSASPHHGVFSSVDCISISTEAAVTEAVADVVKTNGLLALNTLIDIAMSCTVETKVFLLNTIAAMSSSSSHDSICKTGLLGNFEKIVKHSAFQHGLTGLEEEESVQCLEFVALFYELLGHLVRGLRPNEIVLDRLWFFDNQSFSPNIVNSVPLMRSMLRFMRSVFQSFLLYSSSSASISMSTTTSVNEQLIAMTGEDVISSLLKAVSSLHSCIQVFCTMNQYCEDETNCFAIEVVNFLLTECSVLFQSMLKDVDSVLIDDWKKIHQRNVIQIMKYHKIDEDNWWGHIAYGWMHTCNVRNRSILDNSLLLLMTVSPAVDIISFDTSSKSQRISNHIMHQLLSTTCPLNYHSLMGMVFDAQEMTGECSDVDKLTITVSNEVIILMKTVVQQRLLNFQSKDDANIISNGQSGSFVAECLSVEQWFAVSALLHRLGHYLSTVEEVEIFLNPVVWKNVAQCQVIHGLFAWRRSQCLQQMLSYYMVMWLSLCQGAHHDGKIARGFIRLQGLLQYFQINSSPLALRWIRLGLEELTWKIVSTSLSPAQRISVPTWVIEMVEKMFLSLTKLKDVSIEPANGKTDKKDSAMYFNSLDILHSQLPQLPLTASWLCDLLLDLQAIPHILTWSTVLSEAMNSQDGDGFSVHSIPTSSLLLTLCKLQLQLVHVYEEQNLDDDSLEDLSGGNALEEIAKNCLDILSTTLRSYAVFSCDQDSNSISKLTSEQQIFRSLILDFERKSAPTLPTVTGKKGITGQNKNNRQDQELLWAFGERLGVACLHSIIPFECQRFLVVFIFSPIMPSTVKRRFVQEVENLNLFSFMQDFFDFRQSVDNTIRLGNLLPIQSNLSLGHEDYMLVQNILHLFEAQQRYGTDGLVASNFGIYLMLLCVSMILCSSSIRVLSASKQLECVVHLSTWGCKILRILLAVMKKNFGRRRWILSALTTFGEKLLVCQQNQKCETDDLFDFLIDDVRNCYLQTDSFQGKCWKFQNESGEFIEY